MPWGLLWKAGFRGLLIGVGSAAVIFYVASLFGAMPRDVYVYAEAEQPFTLAAVAVTSMVVTLIAVPIFRLLVSFSSDPVFFFRIITAVVFILAITLPFRIDGAPAGMIIAVLLIHLAVTLGIVLSLENAYRTSQGDLSTGRS